MRLFSNDFTELHPIPAACAFGRPGGPGEPCVFAGNRNPHLAWSGAPDATRSFVLMCIDSDAPTRADDVNQPDRPVPLDLPRGEFLHWLMLDIPRDCHELAQGSCSDGVVAHGKQTPPGPRGARQGRNDYTAWFANDAAMAGDYFGYDGPCPPWNDERVHHYHFRLYALDVATLDLADGLTLANARSAMRGHLLAEAALSGTYTLNPALRRD